MKERAGEDLLFQAGDPARGSRGGGIQCGDQRRCRSWCRLVTNWIRRKSTLRSSEGPSAIAVGEQGDGVQLASVFFALLSAVLACWVGASRQAFAQPSAISLVMAWLYCCAVMFTWQAAVIRAYLGGRVQTAGILLTLSVLALPCFVGNSKIAGMFVAALLLLACLRGFAGTLPAMLRCPALKLIWLFFSALLFASVLFFWVNSKGYATVLTPELALIGQANLDTLYHVSIASMLTEHGVVSTGLDGLVHTPYHVLSHLWIGRLSEWLGVMPIHGYYIVVQIVGLPVLLFGLVACTAQAFGPDGARADRFPQIVLVPIGLLLLVAFIDSNSWLLSESYLLALSIFLLGLPLLLMQAKEAAWRGTGPQLLTLGLLGMLMTLAKVSVGAIWFGGVGYIAFRGMRSQGFIGKSSSLLLLYAAFGAFALLLLFATVLPSEHVRNMHLIPFQYVLDYPITAIINTVAISAAVVVLSTRLIRRGRDLPTEVLVVLLVLPWVLAMAINVPSGSTYYFLNVGTWVAVVVGARWLLERVDFLGQKRNMHGLVAIALGALLMNRDVVRSYPRVHQRAIQLAALTEAVAPAIFPSSEVADRLGASAGAQEISTILSRFAFGEPNVLIFVPPENRIYWESDANCSRKPLRIPALTGIPLLNGLPPAYLNCASAPDFGRFYGYSEYSADSVSTGMSDPMLCAKALRLGYTRIGVLSEPMELRVLSCAQVPVPKSS